MPAVRVSDALRYASKFVGLLLAVVVVAGGLIVGGVTLAADAINFTNPSLSALSETPVFIGILLLAVGAIAGVIGWVALSYKFLADGVAAAMAAHGFGTTTETVDGEVADEDETSSDVSASGVTAVGGSAAARTVPNNGDSGDGSDEERREDVATGGERPSEPPTTHPTGAPVGAPSETSEDGSYVPESTAEDGAGPDESIEADSSATASDAAGDEAEEPPEWTPPDPSEFESTGTTGNADDGDDDRWADETPAASEGATDEGSADVEDLDDDTTLADEGVESFSTASEDDPLSDRLPGDDDN